MRILTIDGNNLVYRVYKVAVQLPNYSEYLHVYMFLNSVRSVIDQYKPDKVYCTWDETPDNDGPSFRHSLYPEYKGTRAKDHGKDVHKYNHHIKELLQSMGIPSIFPREFEADDVLAIIDSLVEFDRHIVYTVDRDMCQLITEKTVVYDGIRKLEVDLNNFQEVVKWTPEQFVQAKAIQGDKSDNIIKLKGYGPKKIEKYFNGDVEFTEEEQAQYDFNMKLVVLYTEGDERDYIKAQLDVCSHGTDYELFKKKVAELGFNSITNNTGKWYSTFFQTNRLLELLA